jgi:hypothetical protein
MKKVNLLVVLFILCILGCTQEPIGEEQLTFEKRGKDLTLPNPAESEDTSETSSETNSEDHCFYTNLIAGQHYVAGSVTIDIDGDNLIITYTTNDDWSIGITHLQVGNCDEDWVPLTGSGNPKIGRFEYTEPYSSSDTEVVYVISLEEIGDTFCFAAHAEVQGPSGGETAWAEGTQFSGKSWAMFAEVDLSECTSEEDDDDDEEDDPFTAF